MFVSGSDASESDTTERAEGVGVGWAEVTWVG